MSQELIEHYSDGGEKLSQAIRNLTKEDLLARPAADAKVGLWSIQEVVLHVSDSELVFADRMKRIIAEENPTLQAFDETKWAARLKYDEQSAEDAAALVELTRKQMARVLKGLTAADLQRAGTHNKAGKQTLAEVVKKATDHLEHHLGFIHKKRALMGKEMW